MKQSNIYVHHIKAASSCPVTKFQHSQNDKMVESDPTVATLFMVVPMHILIKVAFCINYHIL